MNDRLQSDECSHKLKAIADPDRLRILQCLQDGPLSVSSIAERLDEPIGTVSHHLGVLRTAKVVSDKRDGRHIIYSLNPGIYRPSKKSAGLDLLDFGCCQFVFGK